VVKRLSFSRLDTFQQCPRKYRLRYVDKAPTGRADALEFGTILHAVLETVINALVKAAHVGEIPAKMVEDEYRDEWARRELTERSLYEEGLTILRQWCERFGHMQEGQVLATEQSFKMQLGGRAMTGIIDRIDRIDESTIRVVDYKTSRAWMLPDQSMQLAIYGTAAKSLYKAERVQVAFDMLRHNQLIACDITAAQMDASAEWAHVLAEQMENATEYAPRLNTFCHWCDYKRGCSEYGRAVGEPLHVLNLADDADALGDTITATKQRLAELQEMQRAQALHGEGPKRPSVRRSRKLPADVATRVLERHGVALPLDVLSIDTKKAQQLTKGLDKKERAIISAELEAETLTANQTVVR
jgi:putative RecB family exonuclease